jgi:hypothetical protein
MTVEALAGADPDVEDEERAPAGPTLEARVAAALLALLPGALIVYFGFRGGGFFPGAVGLAGLIVLQILLLRVVVADDPLAGASRGFVVVAALLAGLAGWTLASLLWTGSADRPLTEFNRALLYLLLFVVMGLLPRRRWRAPWVTRGIAIGAFVVCGAGLVSRVLPHLLPTTANVSVNRLSYPVTYWNALGLIATIGALLATGLACNDQESRWGRAIAAAAVPVFAATLWFTFSRGAMLALVIGLIAFLLTSRQKAIVAGLIAVVPPTAVALVSAYGADQLSTTNPTTSVAVSQGKHVALAVVICALVAGTARFLLAPVDRRVARAHWPRRTRRAVIGAAAGLAAVAVGVTLAAGGASWVGDQFDGFLHGQAVKQKGDLRARLTDPSSNGRISHWKAALDGFSEQPLHGTGAGTYQFVWEKHRDQIYPVTDAHGLYFETLSDLGLVGLLLVVGAILGILIGLARRAQGVNRGFYAALFGAALAWAVHAGVDWHWEMPAATAWVFAVGGLALGSARDASPTGGLSRGSRVTAGVALLVAAVLPLLIMLGQSHLAQAADAFEHNSCARARSEAFAAISRVAVRPEPYQIIGYCDLEEGRTQAALAAMEEGAEREPDSWEYRFGIALARGEGGGDPQPDLKAALALNPGEPILLETRDALARPMSASDRADTLGRIRVKLEESGRLTLK